MSVLGIISVYALVIFISLSVLMIFSNLTFLDTEQSGVQLVLDIPARPRCPDSKIIRHDQKLEWKDTVKNREVSQMK